MSCNFCFILFLLNPVKHMVPVRNSWVDNLRSFITLLVVAHHSSLAYTTFASFNKSAYILSTNPVVDTARWKGLDIFEDFNDIFFMSLMFLISGIFVMNSLRSKSMGKFIRDRFYRLFIPFMIGVTLLMLIAYYPSFLLATGQHNIKAYVIDFFTVEAWPVGPPWFIWVLFVFNLVFALCYPLVKNGISKAGNWLAMQKQHPAKLFLSWYAYTLLLYIPVIQFVSPYAWTGIGPFDFQISRVFLYAGYFLLGAVIGAPGLANGIFADGSAFVKKWPLWVISCLVIYAGLKLSEAPIIRMIGNHQLSELQATLIYRLIWILSCTMSCIAFLTLFKSIFNKTNQWWESLSANAYGIYLVHYIFIVWCQYSLLNAPLHAFVKFLITFVVTAALSWSVVYLVRKNGVVKKYL